jgi:hypothetical protein
VQGQLRNEFLVCQISSQCGHCRRPLHLEIDSELNISVAEEEAEPLVFVPLLDFEKLDDPSIIDAF